MNVDKLLQRIDRAFADIRRPDRFTSCPCDECDELSQRLQERSYETLEAEDIGMTLCLLSPAGLTYWAPWLMRKCLESTLETLPMAFEHFIHQELGRALSGSEPPPMHPRLTPLTTEQTAVILEFLNYIQEAWYAGYGKPTPRELARAIRNWSRFAGVSTL